MSATVAALDEESQQDGFWDDAEKARGRLKERARAAGSIEAVERPWKRLEDLDVLVELINEADAEEAAELDPELTEGLKTLARELENLEFRRMMSGDQDTDAALITINAGAGGTESQDWAEMLLRMYLRYCERFGFKTDVIDVQPGEEAGIKSATIGVDGDYAYGYLRAEAGVHRLVRLSPFDASNRRHTSFASVYVCAQVDDDIDIEIEEGDLRVDTYRSSGAGGQHVNRTDSAVRMTHLPTGIVVSCQNERSQHKNRATAMKVLRARLYEYELKKRKDAQAVIESKKKAIEFGSQIRSYVLHPYRKVKDHRTGLESGNTDAILDGALEDLIKAYLMQAEA